MYSRSTDGMIAANDGHYVTSLGRLVHVSPQDPERFYLRILLCHRRSPKSFEDICAVNGVVHESFHDAALAAGYLENDRECEECLAEAAAFNMPYALRQRFGTILVFSLPDHASALRADYFKSIAERDRQNNIERDEEVRLRMAEYKCGRVFAIEWKDFGHVWPS
ncbi:Helitron helicase [Phytophthora megakarya]|uniref:Helitron helicase n=1 Tax=Phytophthora megakarya TaxID=4795 RepID=A0A225UBJ3_9STRA|nr:Helitron helicase [Phytophthora megakarya]